MFWGQGLSVPSAGGGPEAAMCVGQEAEEGGSQGNFWNEANICSTINEGQLSQRKWPYSIDKCLSGKSHT